MDVEDVEVISIMGAGTMGHGIAEVAALAGIEVRLRDIEEELVRDGYESIEWSLEKMAEGEYITESEAEAALDRISTVVDMKEAVSDADFVIEAVPERADIKQDVYSEVGKHAPDHAIIATNTSSLSITDLSEGTDRPELFCGMHFFNPPVRMDLVEVIRGAHTAEETIEVTEALAEALGKTSVRVRKDSPGFIVNRILVPMLNEAAWIVHDDVASLEAVDASVKHGLSLPMGAFELADLIGIDVFVDILEYMEESLGEAYTPSPLLVERVESGTLGKKTGEGFYDYDDGGAEIPEAEQREELADRLTATMANEVAKLVGNDVADPSDIDLASRLGAGFPTGPAAMADEIGLADITGLLADLHEETGAERYEPAGTLRELAESDSGFHD